jgi:hypothetical protein
MPSFRARDRLSRFLLLASALCIVWAAALVATGGVDWRLRGLRLTSHDPVRPAIAGGALLAGYLFAFRDRIARDVGWLANGLSKWSLPLTIAIALLVLIAGVSHGTFAASGADSYGYVSQAHLWLKGDLTVQQPFAREFPWSEPQWSFATLGYRPSVSGDGIVPTYAPGLPLAMALAILVAGDCGPFLVVPALGALSVVLTYWLGTRIWSPLTGLAAVILLALSPVFVSHLLWPMSDVAVTACWLAATCAAISNLRWRALVTGLLLSAALLVRPNLLPLTLVFGVWFLLARPPHGGRRIREAIGLAIGIAPGVVLVAMIHDQLYGAPWKSGYGSLESLYHWRYLAANLAKYPRWLAETQTPLIFAGLIPVVLALRSDWWANVQSTRAADAADRTRPARADVLVLAGFVAAVWLSYLFYYPFEVWWYLRFLLPAYPMMLLLAVEGWTRILLKLPYALRASALAAIVVLVAGLQIVTIRSHAILQTRQGEARYVTVGRFIDRTLPKNAVILSMQHSGSLRFYGRRLTLRYDYLPPEWWPRALDVLIEKGYEPFILLEDWEQPEFRKRFGLPGTGETLGNTALVARYDGPVKIHVYAVRPQAAEGFTVRRIVAQDERGCRGFAGWLGGLCSS